MFQLSEKHATQAIAPAKLLMFILVGLSLLALVSGGGLLLYLKTAHTFALQNQTTQTVHTVLTAQAKATVTASPQYLFDHVTATTPAVNDISGEWNPGQKAGIDCIFTNNAYHIRGTSELLLPSCVDERNTYTNFVFQMRMTVIKGNGGGIIFRDDTSGNFYSFTVMDSNLYSLFAWKESGKDGKPLAFGRTPVGKTTNTLAVMVQGSKIAMFVNKRYVGSVDDTYSSTGTLGFAGSRSSMRDSIDVAFSHFQIWKL
jgi:hypothetical protein